MPRRGPQKQKVQILRQRPWDKGDREGPLVGRTPPCQTCLEPRGSAISGVPVNQALKVAGPMFESWAQELLSDWQVVCLDGPCLSHLKNGDIMREGLGDINEVAQLSTRPAARVSADETCSEGLSWRIRS